MNALRRVIQTVSPSVYVVRVVWEGKCDEKLLRIIASGINCTTERELPLSQWRNERGKWIYTKEQTGQGD
jgi:hypothetical protein